MTGNRKGFTIVELMIVISIIAILVGIALPRFKGIRDEGNISKAKSELRTIQTALESYRVHQGVYPAETDFTDTTFDNAVPRIISAIPKDPFRIASPGAYQYGLNGDYYVLYSKGVNDDGSASVAADGTVTETNGDRCIYVTNGTPIDPKP